MNYARILLCFVVVLYQSYHSDVIMSAMAFQITGVTIVCSTVSSDTDKNMQRSASLASVRGIHRQPMDSPHKGPITRKMFPFDDVIMNLQHVLQGYFTGTEGNHITKTNKAPLVNMGKLIIRICVVSLPISRVMTTRIYILCLIIIKSEVWTITHCLGLGHETMVCAVCLSAFLQTITQPKQNKAQHPLPIYSDVLFSLRVLCVQDCATLESTSSLAFRWFHFRRTTSRTPPSWNIFWKRLAVV